MTFAKSDQVKNIILKILASTAQGAIKLTDKSIKTAHLETKSNLKMKFP